MDLNKNEDKNVISLDKLQIESSSKEEAIRINSGHLKAWKMNETDMQLVVEPLSLSEMINARVPKKGNKVEFKKNVEKSEGQKAVIQRYYAFDRCFDDFVGNEEVYRHLARDIILDTFKGINGCILAYGQTGSGKTHSVMGVPTDPGMLPRSLAEFFNGIENPSSLNEDNVSIHTDDESNNNTKEFLMSVTYLEVYMERVNDLLQEGYRGGATENLDVKEDPKRGFVVIGVQEETVTSIDEVMLLVAKAEQRRHISQTNFNETSSRSHTIFTVILESNQVLSDGTSINKRGELKIVDLAGNERAGRAAEGIENAKTLIEEGKAINKSLFVLSEVISKLSKRAQAIAAGDEKKIKKIQDDLVFIPWRDSKLTRILSKSLGGNCRASVIVAVHPSHFYLDTSFSTLRFALKCKTIKKKIEVNYLSAEQSVIMQQKELIAKLQNQLKHLATTKNVDMHLSGGDKDYMNSRNPEDDEKILALKNELEEKVKKFQNFILKSEFHVNSNNYRTLRSIDDNTEKSLKYSMTISTNLKNEYNWLRSFDTHEYDSKWGDGLEKYEDQNAQEKLNISKAMDYLKNKSPYKMNSSEISDDAISTGSQKDDLISLNYYNELDELEKLEKNELTRRKKKDKGDTHNNTSANKVYAQLSKLSTMERNYISDAEEKVESKGKKGKKKKGKKANNNSEYNTKDIAESSKCGEKPKAKGNKVSTNNVKRKNNMNNGFKKASFEKYAAVDRDKDVENYEDGDNVEGVEGRSVYFPPLREQSDHKDGHDDNHGDSEFKEAAGQKGGMRADDPSLSKQNSSLYSAQRKERDTKEKRTSIISNLKEKIEEDLRKKKKIISRNVELNKQIKFIMKLMQKVGLSAILTGTVPPGRNIENVLKLQETLKDDLKLCDDKKLVDLENGKINDTIGGEIAYNMSANRDEDREDEDELINGAFDTHDEEAEYNESISHVFINEMFFSFVLRMQRKSGLSGHDDGITPKDIEELLKNEEKPYDVSKKALEDILGSVIANKVDEREEIISEKHIKDEKSKNTIDSILNMLTPWEQKILALLYEQQKMRQNVQKIKEKFSQRIQNINVFIKKILIDKIEVEKHFNRIVQATERYKEDMLKTSDVDSNFKFAGLMKKLEELSISLAEKTRDFKVLAEFHLNLRKQMEKKDSLIKELQEENKLFYLVPKYNELLHELNEQEENSKTVKELKKEFLLMYGRLMLTKKRLQEKEIIEHDMRNLNKRIYTELIESISIIKNLESQNKFLEFKLNMENKKKVEKTKKLLKEKEKLNKVINEMEKMLEEANIDTSGLKNEILANYNSNCTSLNNIESEEDEREKEMKGSVKEKAKRKRKKGEQLKKKTEFIDISVKEKILRKKKTKNGENHIINRGYSAEKITKNATKKIDTNLNLKRAHVKKKPSQEKDSFHDLYEDNLANYASLEKQKKVEVIKKNSKRIIKKKKKKVNNNAEGEEITLGELKSNNSIRKKKKKIKEVGKDLGDGKKTLGEFKSSSSISKRRRKKKSVRGKKESLLDYLNKGNYSKENMDTVLSEGNAYHSSKDGNSTTDIETSEMRHILNKEIEKKKKG
ncbi:kinesin-7, putative [Plasmodium ovale curtisi]|uniref:Kinesin-7, putative n=1 Tax=Plasmodium ovale curtisi TaxID=864141 RepID=A0A1A8W7H5_PLAOA|nr:kinesin-7, putative [Plasmodium ovale curtisi]SBS97387.1 kinesin-7, putative [Plasmodium ovale curtisi]